MTSSFQSQMPTYSTIVRQLDTSPSQSRRYYSLNNSTTSSKQHCSSIKSYDANSTFDSCNETSSKSGYISLSPKHMSPIHINNNNNNNSHHAIELSPRKKSLNGSEYDNLDSPNHILIDKLHPSKTVNNYSTLSDAENSEYNSTLSSYRPIDRPCDKYGFFIEFDNDESSTYSKAPTPQELKNIRLREKKWLQMLHNWKYYINFKWDKIRDRCRKGIPHSLRSQAWFFLCGAHIQKRRYPRLFFDLLDKEVSEEVKNDITKDLHRQFPMHELFASRKGTGQADLFNVLKAFAVYKPKIGYCQAQGPIAAVLLMHMPAEHAFWSLVALSDYYIGGYFVHNLEDIQIHGQMLFAFLKKFSPSSHNLLKRQNIEPILYMTEWFMCIFSRNLPWPCVLRVWDMFLCEGVTILFKVGIYLIDVSLRNENTKTCPSMYETCQKIRNIPKQYLTEETLIKGIKRIDLKDSDLLKEHKIQLKKHRKLRNKKPQQ